MIKKDQNMKMCLQNNIKRRKNGEMDMHYDDLNGKAPLYMPDPQISRL